ncbi:serine hydrolase domain-containing protein [Alkalicoccobacillus gibsonii]|uniref:serine hydrolase domain-containing protein n=1 Tax=Alkalicoccobacillus gibsonii TaxID=79881 RepID=UPI0019316ED2|nr:serine hydrolase domain-containing protein [Alkalicoccobacillus gibsonii]MBM0066782.1 beta-lactamase family protein [Alkalicoccobacillus gibsonii]
MNKNRNDHFKPLNEYVYNSKMKNEATAAATYIIKDKVVVDEWYSGTHDSYVGSRHVDEKTQFNVGSIRKTYLALAISLLIEQGKIRTIDDHIVTYLEEYEKAVEGTSIRHLLTNSHGLIETDNHFEREFPVGESWAYRSPGITMLIKLVKKLSGQDLSAFMKSHVFNPFQLNETGWKTEYNEDMIYNYYHYKDTWVGPNNSDKGDQSNLFISARDLAMWGYIHLEKGCLHDKQILPQRVFERIMTPQTPITVPAHFPLNGFIWWLQNDTPLNQLGEDLPSCSFQILGITGCICLVIPKYNAVVVRMYNQLNESKGYDYLKDIREFGNVANDLLSTYRT